MKINLPDNFQNHNQLKTVFLPLLFLCTASLFGEGRLNQYNQVFLKGYKEAKQAKLARYPLYILYASGKIELKDNRSGFQVYRETFKDELYGRRKVASHIYVSTFMEIDQGDDPNSKQLNLIREKITAMLKQEVFQNDALLVYLSSLLEDFSQGVKNKKEIVFHMKGDGLIILKSYLIDAKQVRYNSFQKIMKKWDPVIGEQGWNDLRIVVGCTHMACDGLIEKSFFEKLLASKNALNPREEKVIVIGNVFELEKLEDYFASHLIDAEIGEKLFGDKDILHKDILR